MHSLGGVGMQFGGTLNLPSLVKNGGNNGGNAQAREGSVKREMVVDQIITLNVRN